MIEAPRSAGVEEEFLVVDPRTGYPVGVASAVVHGAEAGGVSELQTELYRQQLEIASEPRTDLRALAADLRDRREVAARWARREGADVAALATSPLKGAPDTTRDDRYERMIRRFGLTAREQLTCGCHVHVEISSPDEGVAVLDRVRPWLPVLRALSANSPFWQEQDSGFASYRSEIWNRWPSAGPTDLFGSVQGYRDTVDALLATDTLLDPGMLYFDARLSDKYPTVEIRVADVCLDLADTMLVAALSRALVSTAARAWRAGEPADPVPTLVVRLAHWRAARSGLGGNLVDPRTGRPDSAEAVVKTFVDHVADALADTGDTAAVDALLASLLRRGTGATWQRETYERTSDWTAVTRDAVARTAAFDVPAELT